MKLIKSNSYVNNKQEKIFIFYIMVLFLLFVLQRCFDEFELIFQIKLVGFLGISLIISAICIVFYLKKKIDCFHIILVLIGVFMFGQHAIVLFSGKTISINITEGVLPPSSLYHTGFLVLKSIVILNMGYVINCIDITKKRQSYRGGGQIKRQILYRIGLVFFGVSLVPTLIILLKNIYLTFTVGYGARMLNPAYRVSGIKNIAGILSEFMIPALLVLFICRNKKNYWPVVAIIMYMVLYTTSGSRINTFILMIGIVYLHFNLSGDLNLKKILKYIMLLFVIITIFVLVSSFRGAKYDENMTMIQKIKEEVKSSLFENNIFFSVLSEAGYTFYATSAVIENCPSNEPYKYGESYLSAVAYIVPNGLTDNYYSKVKSTDEVFAKYITQYGGIGSSFVAEAYWNFGEFSLILMFLYGLFLGYISKKLEHAFYERNYISIFVFIYIFITIAFYVRSDTRTFLRYFTWFCLPIIIVYNLCIPEYCLILHSEKQHN